MANLQLNLGAILDQHPQLDRGLVTTLHVAGLSSVAAVVLMWRRERTGIYLITLAYGVMLGINLYHETPLAHTMLGPIGLGILYGLVWATRDRFGFRPR